MIGSALQPDYYAVFAVSFLYVGLRSWQQLNVVRQKYLFIMPTSLAMAAADVFMISQIANYGWGFIVLAYAGGGGMGSILATWMHHRWIKERA